MKIEELKDPVNRFSFRKLNEIKDKYINSICTDDETKKQLIFIIGNNLIYYCGMAAGEDSEGRELISLFNEWVNGFVEELKERKLKRDENCG